MELRKTLYKYTGEYYGDIVLASKVDSLNIVSNTKPLSLENKSVDNSKIELFTTNSIKANVDEVNISNQNNSEEFEEKADNNKKWLIGAGIALGAIIGGRILLKSPKVQLKIAELISSKIGSPIQTSYIAKDFNTIKSQLLSSNLDDKFIRLIKDANSPEEITKIIKTIQSDGLSKVLKINKILKNRSLTAIEQQNLVISLEKDYFAKMFDLQKALSLKSTNPRVIEIENILKSQYGMKFVSLKDDVVHAEKVLKSCELMLKNGDKIPQNYIVTNMQTGVGQCLRTESTVLHYTTPIEKILNPQTATHLSTKLELHTIIHEFGHLSQPEAIHAIKIPKHLKNVPKGVSEYAGKGSNAELYAELFAKIKLTPEKVTKEELELFEFLKKYSP